MIEVIKGRVIKLGDDVNTDVISPARWMREGLEVLRLHTMEAIRKDFYKDVQPGDIIVAGNNFGCGSHREPATTIMKLLGVAGIVADSVSRLYFRNCIAYGIPIFGAEGVSKLVEEGDTISLSITEKVVTIRSGKSGKEVSAQPIPETMIRVLEAGGIYPLLKQTLAKE